MHCAAGGTYRANVGVGVRDKNTILDGMVFLCSAILDVWLMYGLFQYIRPAGIREIYLTKPVNDLPIHVTKHDAHQWF